MSRNYCKQILNGGYIAFDLNLELIVKEAREKKQIKEHIALELIQRLADIDIAAYLGGEVPPGGLCGVALELQGLGLLSEDIWKIYAKPEGYVLHYS